MKLHESLKTPSNRKWLQRSVRFRRSDITTRSQRTQSPTVQTTSADTTQTDGAITLSRLTALTQLILIKSGQVI